MDLKIEKENAKIYTKYLLYEKSIDDILSMLDNKKLSYRMLLSSIYDLINNNKIYFLLNDSATDKVRSIISYKRYDCNNKELNNSFNDIIVDANKLDNVKNKEKHIRSFANYDLNIRTLDPKYSLKKSKKEKLNDLKLLLLELQSFDYQYLNMIKYKGYDSINKDNFASFISSTNYLLEIEPEIFLIEYPSNIVKLNGDKIRPIDYITDIIEEYKNYNKASIKTLSKLR